MQLEELLSHLDKDALIELIIPLYLDGKLSEGQASGLLKIDRLELRTRAKDYQEETETVARLGEIVAGLGEALQGQFEIPKEDASLLKDMERDFERLKASHPGVMMHFGFIPAWIVFQAIQLAISHSGVTGQSREVCTQVAKTFEKELAVTPALKEMARRGWNR